MINYRVKEGDMLSVLAVKYKTTISILRRDNPYIGDDLRVFTGDLLKIFTPLENAKRFSLNAANRYSEAQTFRNNVIDSGYITEGLYNVITKDGRAFFDNQIGMIKTKRRVPIVSIEANGFEKEVNILPVETRLHVFDEVMINEKKRYLVDHHLFVEANPQAVDFYKVNIDETETVKKLPENRLKKQDVIESQGTEESFSTMSTFNTSNTVSPEAFIGYGPKQAPTTARASSQAFVGSGDPVRQNQEPRNFNESLLEQPDFKRPMMVLNTPGGKSQRIELRLLSFNASYSNNISPSATNGGWMVNIGAKNLATVQLSGFLMETKAHNEFDQFIRRYHEYLSSTKYKDYFSIAPSKLYYKKHEYRGIVTSFSFSDRQEESLHRKFSMTFLVLDEKSLKMSTVSNLSTVIDRQGLTEQQFRSSVWGMLANPITGNTGNFFN